LATGSGYLYALVSEGVTLARATILSYGAVAPLSAAATGTTPAGTRVTVPRTTAVAILAAAPRAFTLRWICWVRVIAVAVTQVDVAVAVAGGTTLVVPVASTDTGIVTARSRNGDDGYRKQEQVEK